MKPHESFLFKNSKKSSIINAMSKKARLLPLTLLFALLTVKPVFADTTPPTTTRTTTPSSPNGNNGWFTVPVQFQLQATDLESGVKETHYRIDSGAWQINTFEDTLNLAPNPSFENTGSTTTGIESWEATLIDEYVTYSQDTAEYPTGYETASAKIAATESAGIWHGINNQSDFAVATPLENMTASVWLKPDSLAESAYLKVYSIPTFGPATLVAQSGNITGTTTWTKLTINFVAPADTMGVYVDFGLTGAGTVWADAVEISSSPTSVTTFTVGTNGTHTLYYYSVDLANNVETTKTYNFKIDQTPPGNWHGSGATRWFFDPPYKLYVYVTVEDPVSGLKWNLDGYKYHTELHDGFGRFSTLTDCSSTWQPLDDSSWIWAFTWWIFANGAPETTLITPKTSFCNDNWRICKAVRFRAEDLAGNVGTKEFCLNGPWIQISGEGPVRSNSTIDMLAEAEGNNTDGLIEVGGNTIEFFTSSKDWEVKNSVNPITYNYSQLWDLVTESKTEITSLQTNSGTYVIDGNFEISSLPSGFSSSSFNQIVFVNGNLRISTNVNIADTSTLLFVVNGNVEVDKTVVTVNCGMFAENSIFTAYNIAEGDATETLTLNGIFSADAFVFQRTLQGTDNNNIPSEDFVFEPKYMIKLKDFLGDSRVTWLRTQ